MRRPLALLSLVVLLGACGALRETPVPSSPDTEAGPEATPEAALEAAPEAGPDDGPDALDGSATAAVGSARTSSPDMPRPPSPDRGTRLRSTALTETSGLAVSRRDPGVLWAVNDGGHVPALHALTRDGRPLGVWPLTVRDRDWEDLAAFRLDGEPFLLIADTGDNARRRDGVVLHLVPEPVPRGPGAAPGATLAPERSVRFRYEDGAHDVEAVAVDETTGTIWLLTKEPARDGHGIAGGVYTLSLADFPDADDADDADDAARVARRAATLAPVPRDLVSGLAAALTGIDLEQPTAFDIAADGTSACLLTYRRVRCFERADGEDWSETLVRPGRAFAPHGLAQAEALALSEDGETLFFTSEGPLPPLRVRRRR